MRYLVASVVICSILLSSTGSSFAQTTGPAQQQQLLGVYAQIVVKDASGNLVSYIESSNTRLLVSAAQFNQILNQNPNLFKKTELDADGQNIEILQVNDTFVHKEPTIVSLNIISLGTPSGPQILVLANHDGFPVVAGDKMTVYWTIVRSNG